MRNEQNDKDYIAWYILGLFDFGLPISNLSERQLKELWERILDAFRKNIPKKDFFIKGKIKRIKMPHFEESFKLATIKPYESYVDIRRSPLIGFYNRRLIVRLTIDQEEFFELREVRDDILRDLKFVFEELKGTKVSAVDPYGIGEKEWEVKDVFTFPLLIIRNGANLIQEEFKAARKNNVDPIFSIPTTALTYKLPERGKWFSLFSFKEHYIRVSVRSVMVFCDGWIPWEFKQTLINAIYQGGLNEQMRRMRKVKQPLTRQRMRAIDDEILMNLIEIMKEMVQMYIDSARIAEKQRFISFFIAALSFLISLIALLISLLSFLG